MDLNRFINKKKEVYGTLPVAMFIQNSLFSHTEEIAADKP